MPDRSLAEVAGGASERPTVGQCVLVGLFDNDNRTAVLEAIQQDVAGDAAISSFHLPHSCDKCRPLFVGHSLDRRTARPQSEDRVPALHPGSGFPVRHAAGVC
jgi:hypothetical protein